MNTHKITKQTSTEAEFLITVDEEQLTPIKNEIIDHLKKDLKVAGFRPGKVPTNIAERHVDSSVLQTEVLERVIARSYGKAVVEANLQTLSSPKIEIKKFVPFTELEYVARVALMPKIDFDYKKLRVKEKIEKLDEKDVDKTIDNLRRQTAVKKPSKSAIKNGDEVVIDYEGVREGKPVEGAKAEKQTVTVGQGQFIPGFEEELVGMKAGDKKEFEITFPKDYRATDLAGKKVLFKIKVHEVNVVELPELNDTWAKSVGPFKTVEEVRDDARNRLNQEHERAQAQSYENAVIDEAIKKAKFDVPTLLVDEQLHRLEHEFSDNLKNSGLDTEKYLALMGKDQKSLEEELKTEAQRRVKMALLIRHIVEAEQLQVTNDEIEATLAQLRATYTDPHMQEELTHDHFREDVANHLMSTKAIEKLVNYAKGGK